jgi:hypothetical protein
METPRKAMPSPALAAMYENDIKLGIDPLTIERGPVVGETPKVLPTFHIEAPDWQAEAAEAAAPDRATRVKEAAALLESEQPPPQPTPPAAKQNRWQR